MMPQGAARWEDVDPRVFRAAFEVSGEAGAFLGEDGTLVAANAALASLAGADTADLVGTPFKELFAPEAGDAGEVLRRAGAWSESVSRLGIVTASGAIVPVEADVRLFVTSEGGRLFYARIRDERSRLRAERVQNIALELSRAGNAAATLAALAQGVLAVLRATVTGAEILALFGHDPDARALVALAVDGIPRSWAGAIQPIEGDGRTLLGHACLSRESVFVIDTGLEKPPHPTGLPADATSIFAVPLLAGDELLGGLLVASRAPGRLDFEDLAVVELAAAEAASALGRLRVARDLVEAEARYQVLVGALRSAVVVIESGGVVVEANAAASALLGEIDGGAFPFASCFDNAEAASAFLARVAEEGSVIEHLTARSEGVSIRVRVHGLRAVSPPGRAIVIVEDATDEVRSRRLRDLTARFDAAGIRAPPGPLPAEGLAAAAVEATGAVAAHILLPDASGKPVVAGSAGEAKDRLPNRRTLAWLEGLAAERSAGVLASPTSGDAENRIVTGLPALDAWGRFLGGLLLVHGPGESAPFRDEDVPWLRLVGDELARVIEHQRANQRVREALDRERAASSRVKRLNDELEEFTLWTTHDLREPLRSLATLAGYLREEMGEAGIEGARLLAGRIEAAAGVLKDRIHALHAFSALAREETAVVAQDLGTVAERVLAQLEGVIRERGARVEVAPDLPVVDAQAGRLEVVLLNLVENALKYGDPAAPWVGVSAVAEDDQVRVIVEDNGAGVPVDLSEQVFRLFYRGPDQRGAPGTGVGLALVRRVALQHGGDAWVEPRRGGGARFVVAFPRV